MAASRSPRRADGVAPDRSWLWAITLGVLTLVLFAPVRQFNFVNFDDDVFVYKNELVRHGFSWAGVKWAFLTADIDYWRPLSWLSHMLDVELFGLRAGGHHITNALLHALNAGLLFLALRRLTKRRWPSLLAAALFAWHPAHIESVAWVAERKDLLCTSFWFLGLGCYARHAEAPTWRTSTAVAGCFGLGLMSKPMILTFPFLLLVLDVWPLRRAEFTGDWRDFFQQLGPLVKEKLPLFTLMVLAAAATYFAQHRVGAMMLETEHPLAARLMNVPIAYVRYLGLAMWPVDLAILYPLPHAWPLWQVGAALTVIASLSWLAVRRLRNEPWLAVGWFWFLGTLVPVIGLVQVGNQSIADRYTYVPTVGLFVALAWHLERLCERHPSWTRGLTTCALLLLGLCIGTTHAHLPCWRDGISIFAQAVRTTKDNYIALANLANNLARTGQHAHAIDLYRRALAIRPDNAETHYNLASSLGDTGLLKAAEAHYREALRLRPGYAHAHNNLANLLGDTGRVPEAFQHYEECLRLQPGNLEARFNYGLTLADQGKASEAIAQFKAAIKLQPAFTRARLQLVSLLIAQGKHTEADTEVRALLHRDPTSPEGHFNAGSLALLRGEWSTAILHWQQAVRLKPDFLSAVYRLAWTLATRPASSGSNPAAARELADRFIQLAGANNPEALDLLAVTEAAQGAFEPAVHHAQRALAAVGTNAALAAEIRARLTLFQNRKPFLEPVSQ